MVDYRWVSWCLAYGFSGKPRIVPGYSVFSPASPLPNKGWIDHQSLWTTCCMKTVMDWAFGLAFMGAHTTFRLLRSGHVRPTRSKDSKLPIPWPLSATSGKTELKECFNTLCPSFLSSRCAILLWIKRTTAWVARSRDFGFVLQQAREN